jgi:cytoskeletal protein CcmA (bactofilin family)
MDVSEAKAMSLFGKKPEAEVPPGQQPALPGAQPQDRGPLQGSKEKPMATPKHEDLRNETGHNSLLGQGAEFEGKLTFDGTVVIDGKFTGEVFSKDRLQISQGARVSAEVNVGSVVVFGEVIGNIRATQAIELRASAKVKGNVEAPSFIIEKGAVFEGACKMENLGKQATITPLKSADEKK